MDFEKLHNEIYEWKVYHSVNRHGPRGFWEIKRQLTPTEWDDICVLLLKEGSGFFCEMTNTEFGFQLAMAIYADSPFPEVPPECVFLVRPRILPGHNENRDRGEEHWEKMWKLFSTFTHSKRNIEILKFYKMEAPKDRVHYAY